MTESTPEPVLLLATNNAHKVRELRVLFAGSGWRLRTPAELGLTLEPEEDGATYGANALIKARAFAGASGGWALADDSGLEVAALGGAPGVHSARYAGAETPHEQKIVALLAEVGAKPGAARDARFRAAFALGAPDGRLWESEGVWEGTLADAPRGANGFGYDPIFLPLGDTRTSAELSSEEKDRLSHRARAAAVLLPVLRALAALSSAENAAAQPDRANDGSTGLLHTGDAAPLVAATPRVEAATLPDGQHTVTARGEHATTNVGMLDASHRPTVGFGAPANTTGVHADAEERERAAPALSHIDSSGQARMVDVSGKAESRREAVAAGRVTMRAETLALIEGGGIAKGNVLATARIAGIMAAKRTHELIPMCHPLLLTGIEVALTPEPTTSAVEIRATVRTTGKTGVEMEALTAVSVAALTIYDMCKAVDRAMRIEAVRLLEKRGGKSGDVVLA